MRPSFTFGKHYNTIPTQKKIRLKYQISSITAEGDDWRLARKALAPVFVPRNISKFAENMLLVTDKLLDDVFPESATVDISESYLKLAYVVLSETLFSGEIDAHSNSALRDISTFLNKLGKADTLDVIMAPNLIPRLTKFGGKSAVKRLRNQVYNLAKDS